MLWDVFTDIGSTFWFHYTMYGMIYIVCAVCTIMCESVMTTVLGLETYLFCFGPNFSQLHVSCKLDHRPLDISIRDPVAQWQEHLTNNQKVLGSNP